MQRKPDLSKFLYTILFRLFKTPEPYLAKFLQNRFESKISQKLKPEFQLLSEKLGSFSRAQLGQDILAVLISHYQFNNYFVEFGATNGFDLSNTELLESQMGWTGLLAEPAEIWWADLDSNRTASIDHRCVWSVSGVDLNFTESKELSGVSELLVQRKNNDYIESGKVRSVALGDLLMEHKTPFQIGYLSIDTEGSEFNIIEKFDFSSYSFNLITIEHNYTNQRRQIKKLLKNNGYIRVLVDLSKWDDWYVHSEIASLIESHNE